MQESEIKPLILDGGFGTHLELKYKCDLNHSLWSTSILESQPETIYNAHKDFCESGADIHITCTYQTCLAGFDNDKRAFEKSIDGAVKICQRSCNDFQKESGKKAYVAGSCGTYAASAGGSVEYTGAYLLDLNEQEKIDFLMKWHKDRFDIIDNLDCDYLAWETMPTRVEGIACSKIIEKANTPSWITFTLKDEATLVNGDSLVSALEGLVLSKKLIGVGINCSDLNFITGALRIIKGYYDNPKNAHELNPKHIVVYPNSGEIYSDHEWTVKDGVENTLKNFSDLAVEWRDVGATIIGGCCRITPTEIKQIFDKFNNN